MRRALRWAPFLAACVAIWLVSSMPRPPVPEALAFPHADKLWHACAYAGLALLAVLGTTTSRLLVALVLTVAYGAIDELHQGFVPGRERSALDLIADSTGALVALGLVHLRVRARRGAQPS